MSLNSDKALGYVLLLGGLIIIVVSTYSGYRVLTGKSDPVRIFDVEAPTINLGGQGNLELPEGFQLPEGFSLPQSSSAGTSIKIFPDEVFNRLLNSGFYFLAMSFVASSGAKIASIGVQLVKEIKVNVRENKSSVGSTPTQVS